MTCACLEGHHTGRAGRCSRRNRRTNNIGIMHATLLILASLSSDQTAVAANLRSSRPSSRIDNSHTQQNARSLEEEPSFNCPTDHSGYYPTRDCKSYYWCNNGSPASSILYSCADRLLFDVEKGRCDWEQSVHCSAEDDSKTIISLEEQQWASGQIDYEAISKGQASLLLTDNPTQSPVTPPTASPVTDKPTRAPVPYDPDNVIFQVAGLTLTGQYGEAKYFPDFAHRCCRGEKEGDEGFKPDWMTSEHMFRNKERCCTELFDWVHLETCLGGQEFVELNFFGEAPKITVDEDDPGVNTEASEPDATIESSTEVDENTLVTPSTPTPSSKKATLPPTAQPKEAANTTMPTTSSPTTNIPTPMPSRKSYIMSASEAPPPTPLPSMGRPSPQISLAIDKQQQGAGTAKTSTSTSLVEILHPTPQPTLPPTKYPTAKPTIQPTTSEPTPTPPPTSISPTVSSQPTREPGIAVQALADSTVSQNDANKNYGRHPMLLVDGGTAGLQQKYDSLVKFDLSFLESGMSFGKILLRMFVKDGGNFCGRFETTQNSYWLEDSITWMNAPTTTTGVNIGEAWNAVSGEWFELDVTGALKWVRMHDKQSLLSIRISSPVTRRCIFASTNDPGHIPHLFARFSEQDAGAPATGTTSPPPAAAAAAGPRQHGEALMLLPSDDAAIFKEEPGLISGKDDTLVVKDDGTSTQDILLKFDITEMHKTTPRSGVLMLYMPQSCMSAGVFFSTTRHGNGWTEDTVSWSTAPTFQYGGNGLGTEIGSFDEPLEGGKYISVDVMRALSWDTVNYQDAITIRISSNNGHRCEYTSKEGEQPPKLVIQF